MSSLLLRHSKVALAAAGFLALAGCVGDDGGVYSSAGYPGYYEPYGIYYGGWAPGYYVAPYNHHDFHGGPGRSRAAAVPSIPSHVRMGAANISRGAHPSGGSSRNR